ncbi:MAG: hypothetical protein KDD58_15865 [Bdellovibrionales bacterium]|nr:hypothetical protein [Bdellovibrionales bacterium]
MLPKILFFAEAVTSAHLFRPFWFAEKLANEGYEVHLATTQTHSLLSNNSSVNIHYLHGGLSSEVFLNSIRKGQIPFNKNVIAHNLKQDFGLIEQIKPDVVIDDFRLSLSIASEKLKLPHLTINNITWSPYFESDPQIVPDIDVVQKFGVKMGGFLFKNLKSIFEKKILDPFNKIRKIEKLSAIDSIFKLYTSGAKVGYLDLIQFASGIDLPENHRFLGPLLFSFPSPLPEWWEKIDKTKPLVYVSLGSSGRSDLLPEIIRAFELTKYQVIVSTSGKKLNINPTKNIYLTSYIPDDKVLPYCQLYVGNGGSGGAQQALAANVPMLFLPDNYDQWLYSTMLEKLDLARILRPSLYREKCFLSEVEDLIYNNQNQKYRKMISKEMKLANPVENLKLFLDIESPNETNSTKVTKLDDVSDIESIEVNSDVKKVA